MEKIVRLVRSKKFSNHELNEVQSILDQNKGPFKFLCHKRAILQEEETWSWEEIWLCLSNFREQNKIPSDDYVVFLMDEPNLLNWFSTINFENKKDLFVHTSEWENYIYCAPKYPIAYLIAQMVFATMMFDSEEELTKAVHFDPVGCISDLCEWKPDISLKLRTADICSDCLDIIYKKNITKEYIHQLIATMETIRKNMLFCSSEHPETDYGHFLPFPLAITKKKLGTTTDPLRKFLFLIDHFDSLVRCFVICYSRLLYDDDNNWINFFHKNSLENRPSLGNWVQAISILGQLQTDSQELKLPANFSAQIKNVVEISERSKIVKIRNEERGHGYIKCRDYDDSYDLLFIENVKTINIIEKFVIDFFKRYKLIKVISTEFKTKKTIHSKSEDLSGATALFDEFTFEKEWQNPNDNLIKDEIYLFNRENKCTLPLSPKIISSICPECNHIRVLVSDGSNTYIDPLIGHRIAINCH